MASKLGKERIDEAFDPALAINRAINYYRSRGYSDSWIEARLKGILNRNKLTDAWKEVVLLRIMNMEYLQMKYIKNGLV